MTTSFSQKIFIGFILMVVISVTISSAPKSVPSSSIIASNISYSRSYWELEGLKKSTEKISLFILLFYLYSKMPITKKL
jgi:predicted neutral ceramidase superfamily lipid hydrolase